MNCYAPKATHQNTLISKFVSALVNFNPRQVFSIQSHLFSHATPLGLVAMLFDVQQRMNSICIFILEFINRLYKSVMFAGKNE